MRVFIDGAPSCSREGIDDGRCVQSKIIGHGIAGKVTDQCVQLHGGYGYMWEYPVTRAYADARIQRIYGGTSEVMKLIIGRDLLSD